MANPDVVTQFGNPDPQAAPLDITQLVALLNTLVTSQIQGSYIPYVIQHGEPGVNDRDKAWIYVDTQGRPIETRIWWANGSSWRRLYNGMIGEVRMYNGNPATDFDTNGLGNIGGNYDGWHLCNGLDGTPDLSDNFLIAAHMNNSNGHVGYNDGWQTFVDGVNDSKFGGNPNCRLNLNLGQVPRPATLPLSVDKWAADGNAHTTPDGQLWGLQLAHTPNTETNDRLLLPADAGNTSPGPVNVLPTFIAIGYIIFVGYST